MYAMYFEVIGKRYVIFNNIEAFDGKTSYVKLTLFTTSFILNVKIGYPSSAYCFRQVLDLNYKITVQS